MLFLTETLLESNKKYNFLCTKVRKLNKTKEVFKVKHLSYQSKLNSVEESASDSVEAGNKY